MYKQLLSLLCLLAITSQAFATFSDLTAWDLVEDPFHPNLSAMRNSSSVTLTAQGAVPNAFDIGYASVDGSEIGTSAQGYYFLPDQDFEISIDFDVTSMSSMGGGGFGFGVGEDRDGMNSIGIAGSVVNGVVADYFAAGRTNNNPIIPAVPPNYSLPGVTQGTMSVEYDSSTGDFILKLITNPGNITTTRTALGLQNNWTDKPLLASFFLRSDNTTGTELTSGELTAIFSNVTVVSGNVIAVPEPASAGLLLLGLGFLRRR